jgi:hypothetical protein
MKTTFSRALVAAIALSVALCGSSAMAVGLTFTKLTGLTGDASGPFTAVYVADLAATGLPSITQLILTDTSGGFGGSPGGFSGVDLDSIFIAPTAAATAASAQTLIQTPAFDYSAAGTTYVPGTQRVPTDPTLFNVSGGAINFAAATLGALDARGLIPGNGYFSMGDGGVITFNLTSAIDPSVSRYLYIGEVGDNGETFSVQAVPEPSTMILAGLGGLAMFFGYRRRARG